MTSFASQVAAFAVKAKKDTDIAYRKNVLLLWSDVVRFTPWVTGVLRSNWQVGVNSQNTTKNRAGTQAGDKSGTADAIAKLTILDTGIIYNNMEYAEIVENGLGGTSRTPRRMVARAIEQAKARKSVGR